jgi:hypothetical protein
MVAAMRELEDRGRAEQLTNALYTFGLIEILAGEYPAAREHLIASRDLADQSEQADWSTFMSAQLAHLYMLEGNDEEALANARLVDKGTANDHWSRMSVAGAESRVLARRGETAEAVERARAMVADAEAVGFVDYPVVFASALEDLAEVLVADGQTAEACEVLNRIIAMQRAKENVVGVAKAERALARITGEQHA